MWWRLGLLAAVSAVIAFVLFVPMATMSVHLDLPPAPSGAPSATNGAALDQGATAAVFAVGGVLFVLYLALVAWIGRRIVRRHGRRP